MKINFTLSLLLLFANNLTAGAADKFRTPPDDRKRNHRWRRSYTISVYLQSYFLIWTVHIGGPLPLTVVILTRTVRCIRRGCESESLSGNLTAICSYASSASPSGGTRP